MLNRLGGQVAHLADRTRSLAAEALEALDAHEGQQDPNRPTPDIEPQPDDQFERSLGQLVEAVSGSVVTWESSNLLNQCTVLLTQIDVIRQEAVSSKKLSLEQKDIASRGSLVELIDTFLATSAQGDTAAALLEALEHEQAEHAKTRSKISSQLRDIQSKSDTEISSLRSTIQELTQKSISHQQDLESLLSENRQLKSSLEKVIADKARLELERDNGEMIDSRIIRSAFVSLCANADNKKIRIPIIQMMADLLKLSDEDRERAGLISRPIQSSRSGLATEFLQFLHEETFVEEEPDLNSSSPN